MMRTALAFAALLAVPSVAHAELRVPARVPIVSAPRLTLDEVLAKVNTVYMAGLHRCYRKSLADDPTLSSKVILAFRVGADGIVKSELGKTSKLDECLSRTMSGWRFSAPSPDPFRISLVLRSY